MKINTFKFNSVRKNPRTFNSSSTRIKEWSDLAKNDPIILRTVIFWLATILLTLIVIVFFLGNIPEKIPLFYSRLWGPDQLANKVYLLILPAGTFALGISNLSFALISYKTEKIVSYMFCAITILITILSSVAVINILHLIT